MEGGGGMPGGMLPSSMGSTGLLGLEMPLHQQQQPQSQKFLHPHHQQQQQQHPIFPFQTPQSGSDADHQMRHASSSSSYTPYGARGRQQQQLTLSSEDELQPGFGDEGDGARWVSSHSPTPSPWQRMKWTDSMVRLLISVVYRVGDDGGGGGGGEGELHQPHAAVSASSAAKGKKGPAASASATSASALLQKKGKWKSVSRAMMEKGFYVSPQQCEDKFNDLNKRYKRVNDLLGKGTACRVVENQALLDTMDHLTPKAKEEARKLLNSKHLFFREMCAYHHATAAAASASTPPQQMQPPPPSHADQQQQQLCFHHPPTAVSVGGKRGAATVEEDGMVTHEEDEDDDDDIDSEEEDDDDDDDEQEEDEDEMDYNHNNKHRAHHGGGHHQQGKREDQADEDEDSKGLAGGPGQSEGAKRARLMFSGASPPLSLSLSSPSSTSTSMQKLKSELMGMAGGGEQRRRQWLKGRAAELEEQRVGYQSRALQLERQRFKWLRFSTKKEHDMERMKLHNDRLRLENERMLLLLRQKELELLSGGVGGADNHLQQQQLMLQPTNAASHKRPTADHHLNASVEHTSTAG